MQPLGERSYLWDKTDRITIVTFTSFYDNLASPVLGLLI